MDERDINVLMFVKGVNKYIFIWKDSQFYQFINTLGRFAMDKGLSMDWADANNILDRVKNGMPPMSSENMMQEIVRRMT